MYISTEHFLLILVSHLIFSLIAIFLSFRLLKWQGKSGLILLSVFIATDLISYKVESLYNLIHNNLFGQITYYTLIAISFILFLNGLYKSKNNSLSRFALRFDLLRSFSDFSLLSYDGHHVFDHPQTYIVKVNTKGEIVFYTSNYRTFFNVKGDIIGQNILALNETVGHFDHTWFYDTLKNRTWNAESKLMINNEIKWISWHNDVILDKNDNVDFILCVGYEVTRLMQLNENLEFKIMHDPLTKMLNYRGITTNLSQQTDVHRAVCFFISIQNLPLIQNYYGITIAEDVIKYVNKDIQSYSERGYLCGRIAGSGSVVIVFNPTDGELENIIKEMEENILLDVRVNDIGIHVKKNIGYAVYPDQTDDFIKLITLSNLAMIDAAQNEHNEVTKYHKNMSKNLEDNISIAIKLREAINNSDINIYFQKIINTETNKVEYLEALARWSDPELGVVNPTTFLKIARTSNLIDTLEEYLIKNSIEQFKKLKEKDEFKTTKLSINLSPSSFLHQRFLDFIEEQVLIHNIHPSDVCIELSENTFVYNLQICNHFLKLYKEKGFLIAIDDFGKEYSSLSVLGSISYDIIKIDGSFVARIFSQKNQAIIEMIVKIANLYNHQIVAESVETEEQAQVLRELNCFIQQGYYFHRPEKVT